MKEGKLSGVPEQKLSLDEKHIAISLESLKTLGIRDKIFLVLIWRKLKTASAMSFDVNASGNALRDTQEKVEKAGLLFMMTDHIITKEEAGLGLKEGYKLCFVASNQKNMDSISRLWFLDYNNPAVSRELGSMSGYPKTSIDIYAKIHSDEITRLPEKEKEAEIDKLVFSPVDKKNFSPELYPYSTLFLMSRKNWKEEMETAKKWEEEIKHTGTLYYSVLYGNQKALEDGKDYQIPL